MSLLDAYDTFKNRIWEAVQKCSKRKKPSAKRHFMNRSAMQLKIEEKDWAVFCRMHDVLDHARFVRYRNQLRKLTRDLRKEYEKKLAADIKRNPRAFWRYTSTRLKTKDRVENLLDETGAATPDNQAKVEILSKYFSSVLTVQGEEDPPTMNSEFQGSVLGDIECGSGARYHRLSSRRKAVHYQWRCFD